MESIVINKSCFDGVSNGINEGRGSIRKSALNVNGFEGNKTKKLAFNEIRRVYESRLSLKSKENSILINNSTEYLETERRSQSATSKYDNDISYSMEIDLKKSKKSILQNLVYLYNEENKIKITTVKKYSRNATPVSLLKDGMKNSFMKYNDREIAKFQSIDNNSETGKYNLIEKSVLHILEYINDGMGHKYKKKTFLDFLNIQIKSAYDTMKGRTEGGNTKKSCLFGLSSTGVNLNRFNSDYLCKTYFENYEDIITRINSVMKNEIDGYINTSNRDFYLLNLSHKNKLQNYQAHSPPLSPKKTKLKLSSQMIVKSNKIMLFGKHNNKFCSKYLKNDQEEVHKSLNSTREFINLSYEEDAYRRISLNSKGSTQYLRYRKSSLQMSTKDATSPSPEVLSHIRKYTSPQKAGTKINLVRKSIKNIIKVKTPATSEFNSTNVSSVNLKVVDTSNNATKRESFLLTNPNFFKKHQKSSLSTEIDPYSYI
jgi:hypothetical protein